MTAVIVDAAGARVGGAARYLQELRAHVARSGRDDVRIIGPSRRLGPAWLARRELAGRGCRRVALNNVGFITPGGPRLTLLRNALHFLTPAEQALLDSSLRAQSRRDSALVRLAAQWSDLIVAPSSAMAERIIHWLPRVRHRVVVRPHPVSADAIPRLPRDRAIICPVLFSPYKQMAERLAELLAALDTVRGPAVRVRVTADAAEVPLPIAGHPAVDLVGRRPASELRELQARSRAVYFPTGLESFGYPLAEARAAGQPVIARDTPQNREIAGTALCGYLPGDMDSLRTALELALVADVTPDPGPFDPGRYFSWLLGPPQ